jgi:tetratricopeptide (TPR) repeat protein/mono/diheme cytochrome c family protein
MCDAWRGLLNRVTTIVRFTTGLLLGVGAALCLSATPPMSAASPQSAAGPSTPVTFAKDIQPIVIAHCAACHRPDGSASFSLLTYADMRQHGAQVVAATKSRYMPPWKPEPGVGEFVGVRRLADAQIGLLERWVTDGMIEGTPSSAVPPTSAPAGAWRLGEPDLVLTMPAYTLRPGGDDMYRHFVLPMSISAKRYVKAWELRPGNLRVVHHATMEVDATGMSRHLDEADPAPGYEGLIAHTSMAPDGYFLDWAPGHTPYVAPDGMAFPVEANSDLVLMLHMRPSGKPEMVQASVGLYFTDVPPTRVPALLRLTRQDIDIPADERRHVISTSYRLPVDVDVYTVQPHAHNLAREVEGFATLPDGTVKRLLSIKDWDFNWQDVYQYVTPVALPAGASVTMRWTYDNSSGNRLNPNTPPKRVRFGQRTSDEMAELWFQVLPRNQADRNTLTRGMQSAQLFENIKGYEVMLLSDAGNAALHNDVALLYARAGNLDQVAAHFAASARITPDSAPALYNLGTALLAQGKRDEARRAFVRAVEIDGGYAAAYRSLGIVAQSEGKIDDAARYYREAIARAPADAIAHHNLGMLLQVQHQLDEAVGHYREALRINGDYADALVDLAWALATSPDADSRQSAEALQLAERGAQLTRPQTSVALDVLAASLAAAGRFDEAIATAERAIALATAAKNDREVRQIAERLDLYRRRTPFRVRP